MNSKTNGASTANGFTSRKKKITTLAARLLLMAYNLWNLFLRLKNPHLHIEAARGRRWFLFIAACLTHSGGQKYLHIAATGTWWTQLRDGYQRVAHRLAATAPQLKSLTRKQTISFAFLAPAPHANCGF